MFSLIILDWHMFMSRDCHVSFPVEKEKVHLLLEYVVHEPNTGPSPQRLALVCHLVLLYYVFGPILVYIVKQEQNYNHVHVGFHYTQHYFQSKISQ